MLDIFIAYEIQYSKVSYIAGFSSIVCRMFIVDLLGSLSLSARVLKNNIKNKIYRLASKWFDYFSIDVSQFSAFMHRILIFCVKYLFRIFFVSAWRPSEGRSGTGCPSATTVGPCLDQGFRVRNRTESQEEGIQKRYISMHA